LGYLEHMKRAREHVSCAVLTISDSRTEETDKSGLLIIDALEVVGHGVVEYLIVPDSVDEIGKTLDDLLAREDIEAIIMNGGTGITQRDITPEVVSGILEKRLDGFGELFRMLSYQEIGPAAMMSRALGGVSRGKVLLCLPGSKNAVRMAMEKIIVPQIGHMVLEVNK